MQAPFCMPLSVEMRLTSPTFVIPMEAADSTGHIIDLYDIASYEALVISFGELTAHSISPTYLNATVSIAYAVDPQMSFTCRLYPMALRERGAHSFQLGGKKHQILKCTTTVFSIILIRTLTHRSLCHRS